MFCSNCGNQLPKDALFCQKCGTKVDREESAACQKEMPEPNNIDNHRENMEDVRLENGGVSQTTSEETTDSTKQGKFNGEKQIEHYKEMSQEMLGNLKKIPYQRIFEKLKEVPLLWKIGTVVGILLLFIVVCVMVHKPGKDVREACLDYYSSSVTVEEAFDSFFEDGKWSEHKEDGDTYVVFTGKCSYLDETVKVKIRFRIDDDYFYFANMEMNGQPQADIISEALFDRIYESYD